jgi:hypothetical protein
LLIDQNVGVIFHGYFLDSWSFEWVRFPGSAEYRD